MFFEQPEILGDPYRTLKTRVAAVIGDKLLGGGNALAQ